LGWQCRRDDLKTLEILKKIHHPDVQDNIHIERTLLQKMEGGCQLPLGVYCTKEQNTYHVHVAFSSGLAHDLLHFSHQNENAENAIEHCLDKLRKWQEYSSAEN